MQAAADSVGLESHSQAEQVQASLQIGADARQLIMEGVIQLQVSSRKLSSCSIASWVTALFCNLM